MMDIKWKDSRQIYWIILLVFGVWISFFDASSLRVQLDLWKTKRSLEKRKAYYESRMEQLVQEREELLGNDALLEKYARERYFMKKANEDVYVVEEN
ncbi:MAG: FtsB family cell division protein [Nitritalea sp.]